MLEMLLKLNTPLAQKAKGTLSSTRIGCCIPEVFTQGSSRDHSRSHCIISPVGPLRTTSPSGGCLPGVPAAVLPPESKRTSVWESLSGSCSPVCHTLILINMFNQCVTLCHTTSSV